MTETQFEDLPEGKWGSLPTWVTSHIYRGILSQVVEEKGRPVFELVKSGAKSTGSERGLEKNTALHVGQVPEC